MIELETIECVRLHDQRRFENLLAGGLVIAEREVDAAVWLEVFEEEEPRPLRMARN